MEPQQPASSGNDDAGAGAEPVPEFTSADKRKVDVSGDEGQPNPEVPLDQLLDDDTVTDEAVSEATVVTDQDVTDLFEAELVEAELLPERDPNEKLAAERLEALQRLQAEYANYRKRVERDRDRARELAIRSVIESLLPVLDDVQLARQHGDLESGPLVSIADKLESTLAKYGVERFGDPGAAFDPVVHDALMHVDDELAEGTEVTTVVSVLQPGYKIGDTVVRPARVSVADPK
jgi:molecular chaperone GrpE